MVCTVFGFVFLWYTDALNHIFCRSISGSGSGAGTAATQAITNASAVVFTANATATVNGAFIVNDNTKGGTSGTLWTTGSFSSSISVVSTDVIRVTYTVSA